MLFGRSARQSVFTDVSFVFTDVSLPVYLVSGDAVAAVWHGSSIGSSMCMPNLPLSIRGASLGASKRNCNYLILRRGARGASTFPIFPYTRARGYYSPHPALLEDDVCLRTSSPIPYEGRGVATAREDSAKWIVAPVVSSSVSSTSSISSAKVCL